MCTEPLPRKIYWNFVTVCPGNTGNLFGWIYRHPEMPYVLFCRHRRFVLLTSAFTRTQSTKSRWFQWCKQNTTLRKITGTKYSMLPCH